MNCRECNSDQFRKNGTIKLKSGQTRQVYKCKNCGTTTSELIIPEETKVTGSKSNKKYIITSYQIGSEVDQNFLNSLLTYSAVNESELIIIPINIGNAAPVHDEELEEYFLNENIKIHPRLNVLGKLKISPTAQNPLSGLDHVTRGDSIIVGHNQLQLKTLAVAHTDTSVIMTSTGTISKPNYSESKAGYKAGFNHSNSAIVVELKDEFYHLRQIQFDGSGFYDLDSYYTIDNQLIGNVKVAALIPGDEHAIFSDPIVKRATYGNDQKSIIFRLQPEIIVRHDLLDCYSVSHHHTKNVFTQFAKWKSGYESLEEELSATVDYVIETTPKGSKNVVISSNHNDHLLKWLADPNAKVDNSNKIIYHKLMYKMLLKTKMEPNSAVYPNPFELYSEEIFKANSIDISFISRNESYKIKDIELAFHGDIGSNGARGSRNQFSKLPSNTVIGHSHSHSPGIEKGCYQVGTSSYLELEYNAGPSSWMNTHCVIYPNGTRTLINIINGEWHG